MNEKSKKSLLLITLSVLNLTHNACAQDAEPTTKQDVTKADVDKAEEKMIQVVVTGSTSLKRTVRESSVAVTVADREDLDRKAPRSTASALELIPGMMVEDSGGEISNNFTVRGLAGGGQNFVQISEDGLPIFYYSGLADTILRQEISIDRLEAVRGGTSGILTVNGAGATVNFITFRAKDEAEGMFRLTTSDYGTKRVDARYGGPLGHGWYAGFGGFFRSSDSVRDVGFTADHGGLFRAYLGHKFADGEFSINVKMVNDHNTFLLPTPFENSSSGIRPTPGFNGNYGTMISADNAVQFGRNSNGIQTNDLTDGVSTKSTSIGYNFEQRLSDSVTLRSKGRYTDFKNEFNAVFTYDNDSLRSASSRLDATKNSDIAAMLARFSRTTAAIQGVANGTIYSGVNLANVGGNGLVTDNISAKSRSFRHVFNNDISLSWATKRNSFTAGLLTFDQRQQEGNDGNTRFLGEVKNNPNRLDIVAINSSGKVIGQLTDKSVLQYNPWGVGLNRQELISQNIYVNDEFKVNDRLRVDAGVRFETLHFRAWLPGSEIKPIPGAFKADGSDADNIIVNNEAAVFNGRFTHVDKGAANHTSATAGGNYLINDNLATYARYSQSYQAQNENPVTDINFAEFGLRYMQKGFSAVATVFRTTFKDFNYSRRIPGDVLDTVVHGDILVNGLEFELLWRPVKFAQITATGVFQKSRLSVGSITGPSATAISIASIGSHPERSPDVNYTITPSLLLPRKQGEVYMSFHQVGKRFADAGNTVVLPAYHTVDLGANYKLTEKLSLNISVQNVTNTIGLTEGNPRSGFSEGTNAKYFFARAILGRNIQLNVTAWF